VGQVDAIVADLARHSEDAIRRLASEVHAELVEATPIDIGWARANWVPSVGAPFLTDPITDPEATDVQVQLGAASAGLGAVANYTLADGAAFVSNNVPYIRRLDEGWSAQAPAGFVKAAIERAVRNVR
jgi:hypothetical protein